MLCGTGTQRTGLGAAFPNSALEIWRRQMQRMNLGRWAALLLVAGLLGLTAPSLTLGASADYRFEATQPRIKMDDNARVVIRLIHVPTGKPVPDAIIFQTHLEMAMQGSAPMLVKASRPKATGGGLYALQAPLNMEGQWTLHLSAKVQGEKDTVVGAVKLTVIE
jgi:hypothetical protein